MNADGGVDAVACTAHGLLAQRAACGEGEDQVALVGVVSPLRVSKTWMAASDSGTRCGRSDFMRAAGICQMRVVRLISDQGARRTSSVRMAVRMANSKARAAVAAS